jgi:hypothetical protein
VGLELLQAVHGIVDEGETGGLASTEVGAESKNGDAVSFALVELSELGAEVVLGDVCEVHQPAVRVSLRRATRASTWMASGYILGLPGCRISLWHNERQHLVFQTRDALLHDL